MTCDRCGGRTTRSHLCPDCSRDERHGQSLDADQGDSGAKKVLTIECCGCEEVREVDAQARKECPECGHDGYRTLAVRSPMEVAP